MATKKNSITIRNSEGKQLFYTAVNPNQEIVSQGIVYNNSNQNNLNDNAYPNEIFDTWKQGSSVHSRYINLKRNLIYGNGLEPVDPDNDALWDWIEKQNATGLDANDVLDRVSFDMALYEGTYLQVIYDSMSKPVDIYHTDFQKIRAAEPNDLGFTEKWYYSDTWGIVYNQRYYKKAVRNQPQFSIQNFNPNRIENGRQIMQIMKYNGGAVYPILSYNSVLPYIKLAYQLGVFELNRAIQGFLPTTLVYIVGINGEEEQKKYVQNFENNFVGVDKSKVLFMFGENTDAAPKIEKIDATEKESVFEKLIDICNQQITIAHSGSMPLSGIDSKGQQLGGDQNLLFMSRENFMVNEIIPTQRVILKAFNKLVRLAGIDGELTIVNDPLHITLPAQAPEDLTRTERRHMLWGLEPLPEDMEQDGTPTQEAQNMPASGDTTQNNINVIPAE